MNLPFLPKDTRLSGSGAILWATAILHDLYAPVTNKNVGYLCGWFLREGGGGQNNPMNTTLKTADSVGALNSVDVQDYATPAGGVAATVATLNNYRAIVLSLQAGDGITGAATAVELARWSGGGYSSIQPVPVEINVLKGVATFKGSVNFTTGEWNIQGTPGDGNVQFGKNEGEWSAEIQVSIGPNGGKWRIKGEPVDSKPLGQ